MSCDTLLNILNDYIDGDIDPELRRDFEVHLHGCDACQIVVDNIRKTITLYKEGREVALPDTLHVRLNETLARQWKEIH